MPGHHLSSDHAPSTLQQKAAGTILRTPVGGLPGLDTTLPLMINAALSRPDQLRATGRAYAEAPSRRYGLRGKGRIQSGYDADLVFIHPHGQTQLTNSSVHSKAAWTPYNGRTGREASL